MCTPQIASILGESISHSVLCSTLVTAVDLYVVCTNNVRLKWKVGRYGMNIWKKSNLSIINSDCVCPLVRLSVTHLLRKMDNAEVNWY